MKYLLFPFIILLIGFNVIFAQNTVSSGLEITNQGIIQHTPCLPSQWKKLTITGVGPEKKTFTIVHHK